MQSDILDITPDPKVLLALTQTPLKPLDALCELIDNGIDAFAAARIAGTPTEQPMIEVTVPGSVNISRSEGVVRVVDNGAGLDRVGLANTLRAGFSGKNRYDSLGLFGMGFNIATGKLGRQTVVTTARREDKHALRVTIDLPTVVASREFKVPVEEVEKPANFLHGTIIEVSDWWPEGDANAGFAQKLSSISKVLLRSQLGRRYATLLRRNEADAVRIIVNQEALEPFVHCVWSEERFVERKGWGNIPAQIAFNELLTTQRRCVVDGSAIPAGAIACVECGSEEFRTIEERVKGWVGIQRFDDNNKYGIDLVRKGRTIRVQEKDAFFSFANNLGEPVKEYPTDQQSGRIVGEIHLDHVPVDFQKQDFQRSTDEWTRAITFLRGGSLLPSNWEGDERNESPVSKMFQGYRKVRVFGRGDLYMGKWDDASGRATRVPRSVESEFYTRFLNGEPGYVDDERWWELVEQANVPPTIGLEECPHCGFQNVRGADVCDGCDAILKPKSCVECGEQIILSAISCPHCGASQIPEVETPWTCLVCDQVNSVDDDNCAQCGALRGAPDPMSHASLIERSEPAEELSFENRIFSMADGRKTEPLDVIVRRVAELRTSWDGDSVPTTAIRAANRIELFVDDSHPVFSMGVTTKQIIATETAQYLYGMRSDLYGRVGHSVPNIAAVVLTDVWGDTLVASPDAVADTMRSLFESLSDRLADGPEAAEFYGELDDYEQRDLADRLIALGRLDELTQMKQSGSYLRFAGPSVLAKYFRLRPDTWFGTVWNDTIPLASDVGAAAAATAREQTVGNYSRCLDDCAAFVRFVYRDPLVVARALASRDYLEAHLIA